MRSHPCLAWVALLLTAAISTRIADAFCVGKFTSAVQAVGGRPLFLAQGDKETQDEMLSRLLKQRIAELEMMDDGNDDDDDDVPQQLLTPPPPFKVGSYEMLSLLVSAFFAATVFLSGGTIFANAPAPTARVILDADELLRQDFARDASSVRFGVKDYELAPTSLDKTFSSWR